MKVLGSYLFRAVCSILVGFLLAFNPDKMTVLLVQIIGGLFLVSGLVSVINYVVVRYSSKTEVRPMFPIVGVGSLLFGLFLGFFPEYFIAYLMLLLGCLMVVAGIGQLSTLVLYRKVMPFYWPTLLVPFALLVAGGVVVLHPMASASLPFIILGVCCIVYGLSEFIYGLRLRHYLKKAAVVVEAEEVE